jgi:hypothetical protein
VSVLSKPFNFCFSDFIQERDGADIFMSITAVDPYSEYSFEELRLQYDTSFIYADAISFVQSPELCRGQLDLDESHIADSFLCLNDAVRSSEGVLVSASSTGSVLPAPGRAAPLSQYGQEV